MPFDTRHAPGSHSEFVALVEEAVVAADPHNESVWIEWKSRLDLTTPADKVGLARSICGMANRMPEVAAPYCEGRAYVVVGAESGKLHGITSVDPADLSNWLEPYLGRPGPRWQQHWTRTQNVDVLVVEVGAPRQGDPPYPIRKEGPGGVRNGDVFVRRPGKTEKATAAEIDDLVRRASVRSEIRGVRLAVAEGTACPVDLSEAAQDQWLETERGRCLESLREFQRQNAETKGGRHLGSFGTTRRDGLSVAEYEQLVARRDAGEELTDDEVAKLNQASKALNDAIKSIASSIASIGLGRVVAEDRTPEEYEREVADYIEQCHHRMPNLLDRSAAERLPEAVFGLHNDTGDNYPQVQVELHIPGAVVAFEPEPPRASNEARLPSPPRKYGQYREPLVPGWLGQSSFLSPTLYRGLSFERPIADAGPTVEIDNRGSATLMFSPVDLRPHRSVRLAPVVLAAQVPATIIQATWSATTTGASGVLPGRLEIPVQGELWTVADAVAESHD